MFMYLICKAGMVLECVEAFLAQFLRRVTNCHKEFTVRLSAEIDPSGKTVSTLAS